MSRTERIDEVLRHCSGRILDLGCAGQKDRRSGLGSRYWLHGRIVAEHPDAWGLEYHQDNADELLELGIRNVVLGDAQDFDFDEPFDTIVAGELIEHLENPGGLLRSAKRNLAEGGRIVVTTPYPFGVGAPIYAWLKYPRTVSNPDHTLWLCPATMEVLAGRVGLRVESLKLVDDRRPDLPSRVGRWYARLKPLMLWLPIRMRATNMVHVLTPE